MLHNLLVVIPAHNESKTISRVVSKITNLNFQALVINDASTDNTRYLAEKSGAHVLDMAEQVGYGRALRAGFLAAIREEHNVVVTIDADGAHDPEDLPNLLNMYTKLECDLMIGNRFESNALERLPSTKRWSNYLASSLLNRILRTTLRDVSCGYRVLKIDLVEVLLEEPIFEGFELPYGTIAIAKRGEFKIGSAPVSVHYDASQILYTRQKEFLDLLNALRKMLDPDTEIHVAIGKLQDQILRLHSVTIVIDGINLCLHPLVHHRGYLFQAQDQFFNKHATGQLIDFDSITMIE